MAKVRIKLRGFIELPDGAELPEEGSTIHGSYVAEVTGKHSDLDKREAEGRKRVMTAPAALLEGSTLDEVFPPTGPMDEATAELPEGGEG